MELYGEMKLRGDDYAGGYSCGMTMCGSGTMAGFSREEATGKIVYRSEKGVVLAVRKVRRERHSAYRPVCSTEAEKRSVWRCWHP